ncbi:MAG TPA: hypothetical protein VFT29_11560 [Gemmatimonadaceae bacterium]|nr:hypothetical protein [Gemmatimonadaceae bacterium]
MQTPTPPTPPTPVIPATPAIPQAPTASPVVVGAPRQGPGSPADIYEAFRNQREELGRQLERLEEQRSNVSSELRQPELNPVDQRALEQRLTSIDQRIATTEKAIADADAMVARAAAVPGAIIVQPAPPPSGPPEEVFVLSGLFMVIILLPLSIAFARRIWRRGAAVVTKLPQDIYDRFARVDQSLDAIAVEVERIGEGQRFLTKMQTERERALGAGPAERVDIAERERERQGRK